MGMDGGEFLVFGVGVFCYKYENTHLESDISVLFELLLPIQSQYMYLVIPVSPELAHKVWLLPVAYFTSQQAACDMVDAEYRGLVFLSDVAEQVCKWRPVVFCFAVAELGLPVGLFVYGVIKQQALNPKPIFFGGGMVAQVWKAGFSVRNFPDNLWAGTKSYPQFVSLHALLVRLSACDVDEKFEKILSSGIGQAEMCIFEQCTDNTTTLC